MTLRIAARFLSLPPALLLFSTLLPGSASAGPSREEVGKRNREFLESGETERRIERLKNAKVPISNEEDREVEKANSEMLVEFTTLFVDLKSLSAQLSDTDFFNPVNLKSPKDLDWRIAAVDRAMQLNSNGLTEQYWEAKYRSKLTSPKISQKKRQETVDSFMRGVRTGLENRAKQLGLGTPLEVERYKQAEQKSLGTTKKIFELLREEWGKWTYSGSDWKFENPEAEKRFVELDKELSRIDSTTENPPAAAN